jgi:hypothetical protein
MWARAQIIFNQMPCGNDAIKANDFAAINAAVSLMRRAFLVLRKANELQRFD